MAKKNKKGAAVYAAPKAACVAAPAPVAGQTAGEQTIARRAMVNAAKAALESGSSFRAVCTALKDEFGAPGAELAGLVRQAERELRQRPLAEAALKAHLAANGRWAESPARLAWLVLNGPAKPALPLGALREACERLLPELRRAREAAAVAAARKAIAVARARAARNGGAGAIHRTGKTARKRAAAAGK